MTDEKTDKPSTALAVTVKPTLMRPIASEQEIIAARAELVNMLPRVLEQGVDVIRIPKTDKDVLSKAGAERVNIIMGTHPAFEILEQEIDHDRVNHYEDRYGKKKTSVGLYRFVVRCRIMRPDGLCAGEGIGSCATMEGKYVTRPRDLENTALKMASKRALVAATLHAFGLSDRLTQDVEDFAHEEPARPQRQPEHSGANREASEDAVPRVDTDEGLALDAVHAALGRFDASATLEEVEREWEGWKRTAQGLGDKIGPLTRWGMNLWRARARARLEGRTPELTDRQATMLELLASSRSRAVLETSAPLDGIVDGELV